jgi:hypothetical protein
LFVCLDRSTSDTHRQKTNQCHLLVFFITIGLTRSETLQCFLYTSCSNKDQNSEANRKRQERRPTDRICRLCRGTRRTRMPMSLRSTRKTHRLASKRMPEPPQHTRILRCRHRYRKSNGHIFVSTCKGYIQYISQHVHAENIYYSKDMSTQPDV